jgi:large subunit ribosomal protein L10
MGRTLESKQELVEDLKQILSESQIAIVIDYQGLSVAEITDLRRRLLPTGTVCKVTKNTLMRRAIDGDDTWQPMTEFLIGATAVMLVKDDIGGAIRAYQDFQKTTKKTEFRGGVMQGRALSEAQVKAIADLPSKEVLIAQVAGALNSIATRLAVSINEVPASLGRSINEVPASLGRCLQAIAAQQEEGNGDA